MEGEIAVCSIYEICDAVAGYASHCNGDSAGDSIGNSARDSAGDSAEYYIV
ncbi:hypothetical protein BGX38DRAFT_1233408 [Terfezia claveryi]|nr:hypothetical protein BGX38DRAFT_1233408 [Terfezia claveryi]